MHIGHVGEKLIISVTEKLFNQFPACTPTI